MRFFTKSLGQVKKEKIIKCYDGIGMINFRAEITANNIDKLCKELMNSEHLYIIAEGKDEAGIREKWIEYQYEINENSQEKADKIFIYIQREQLQEEISNLIESGMGVIIIVDSFKGNDFFGQYLLNMCDSRKCIKVGIIKAMLYLDLVENPFDITYAYNLKQELPFLSGKYYELTFEFE